MKTSGPDKNNSKNQAVQSTAADNCKNTSEQGGEMKQRCEISNKM